MRPLRGLALHNAFDALLAKHNRIAIVGGPQVAKTTLSRRVKDRPVFGTDEHKRANLAWADVPAAIIKQVEGLDRFVVEGVMVARALRGSKDGTRAGITVDCIVCLNTAMIERLPGQERMAKGVATIFADYIEKNPDHPPIEVLT